VPWLPPAACPSPVTSAAAHTHAHVTRTRRRTHRQHGHVARTHRRTHRQHVHVARTSRARARRMCCLCATCPCCLCASVCACTDAHRQHVHVARTSRARAGRAHACVHRATLGGAVRGVLTWSPSLPLWLGEAGCWPLGCLGGARLSLPGVQGDGCAHVGRSGRGACTCGGMGGEEVYQARGACTAHQHHQRRAAMSERGWRCSSRCLRWQSPTTVRGAGGAPAARRPAPPGCRGLLGPAREAALLLSSSWMIAFMASHGPGTSTCVRSL